MKKLSLLLMTVCLCLTSCIKNQFKVEMDLTQCSTPSYQLTYYASSKKEAFLHHASIPLNDGKGTATCPGKSMTLVWVFGSGRQPIAAFLAERGDNIRITGDGNAPDKWKIDGNSLDEKWWEWRAQNAPASNDDAKRLNAAVEKYVKAHPSEVLSTVLMLGEYDRETDEEGFRRLWNSLSDDARDPEVIAAFARADQQGPAKADANARIASLRLHVKGDSAMTFKTSGSRATLFYFWTGNEPSRDAHFDSLKKLNSSMPARLRIVDIGMARDTVEWINRMRRDSVKDGATAWIRAWVPGGRMNASLEPLRIPVSPYFIVVDSMGRQTFRGSEAADAIKAARKSASAPVKK